jgi:hypothetical protein
MESRIVKEICDMSVGMGLKDANDLTKSILRKIKKDSDNGRSIPKGKSYMECYDENICPSDEYISLWEDKKMKLKELGLGASL